MTANRERERCSSEVVLKVGPVKARFSGDVLLDTVGVPEAFSLTGQGNGGAAGHARGSMDVALKADGTDKAILRYEAKAMIDGKLARQGSRLVQSTAKKWPPNLLIVTEN